MHICIPTNYIHLCHISHLHSLLNRDYHVAILSFLFTQLEMTVSMSSHNRMEYKFKLTIIPKAITSCFRNTIRKFLYCFREHALEFYNYLV